MNAILALTAQERMPDIPWLLFGGRLLLDPLSLALLASTAVVWVLAGAFALGAHRDDQSRARFLGFLALSGLSTLAATVAGDPITFFLCYSVLGLSAYPLVAHRRTGRSIRTARAYLVFMLVGEGALLAGLMLATGSPGGVDAFPGTLSEPEVAGLFLVGFGVKAGVPLLHAWMPAAYRVTPPAATALLAGGTVGVGVLGWVRFGLFAPGSGVPPSFWVGLGVTGTFFGVVRGLTRREPERILAYSSVSQMGVVTTFLAASGASDDRTQHLAALAAAAFLAHHALAKASLFLGVGIVRRRQGSGPASPSVPLPTLPPRDLRGDDPPRTLVGLAIPALALAGLPFTSGALAKGALADLLHATPGRLDAVLSLSAVATTVLMLHFLASVRTEMGREDERRSARERGAEGGWAIPLPRLIWGLSILAVLLGVWLWPAFRPLAATALAPEALLHALWPPLVGGLAWSILRTLGWRGSYRPTLADRLAGRMGLRWDATLAARRERGPDLRHLPAHVRRRFRQAALGTEAAVESLDRRVGAWTLTGVLFLGILVVLRLLF